MGKLIFHWIQNIAQRFGQKKRKTALFEEGSLFVLGQGRYRSVYEIKRNTVSNFNNTIKSNYNKNSIEGRIQHDRHASQ